MDFISGILHRLSPSQLRALHLLSKSSNGIISSTASGKAIGKIGKALGGVFSSLVRHKIHGETLVLPWGKSEDGRGLKWKLNTHLISKEELHTITSKLLEHA